VSSRSCANRTDVPSSSSTKSWLKRICSPSRT